MKKYKLGLTLIMLPFFIVLVVLVGAFGGGAASSSAPIMVVATEDEAYGYMYIGTELGVPWDIVLLTDAIDAYAKGRPDVSEYNPILTALEFCIIAEEEYHIIEEDVSGNAGSGEPTQEEEEADEWELVEIRYYTGLDEILEYLEMSREDLSYKDVNELLIKLMEVAEIKSEEDPEIKYVNSMLQNKEYETVLRELIGMDEDNIRDVMDLYMAQYLAALYGFEIPIFEVDLSDIVVGEVTRMDLARVAVSLMNWPYQMGGKSSAIGPPAGPLDCSGYVDWVYIQCFGVGVSTGRVPEGVAVAGTSMQWFASTPIDESELKIGDLAFLRNPETMRAGEINHVGIYIGKSMSGDNLFIHCAGKRYGYEGRDSGRVGISKKRNSNGYNPVTGEYFDPQMPACNFKYFRRPNFGFIGD